jgi:cell division protein FtsB
MLALVLGGTTWYLATSTGTLRSINQELKDMNEETDRNIANLRASRLVLENEVRDYEEVIDEITEDFDEVFLERERLISEISHLKEPVKVELLDTLTKCKEEYVQVNFRLNKEMKLVIKTEKLLSLCLSERDTQRAVIRNQEMMYQDCKDEIKEYISKVANYKQAMKELSRRHKIKSLRKGVFKYIAGFALGVVVASLSKK